MFLLVAVSLVGSRSCVRGFGSAPAFGEWLSGVWLSSLSLVFVCLYFGPVSWCSISGTCTSSGVWFEYCSYWCVGFVSYRRSLLFLCFRKELALVLKARIRMEIGLASRIVGAVSPMMVAYLGVHPSQWCSGLGCFTRMYPFLLMQVLYLVDRTASSATHFFEGFGVSVCS